ncbi:MAG: pyridoxal-phosphate dependent enzyme [Lysobacterales bacterium]
MSILPDIHAVEIAAARIAPWVRRTEILRSSSLDALASCEMVFKCENFQHVGAFKFRGACNAVFSLDDEEAALGIATQSSGNHGAAIARAAQLRGVPAYVVVPTSIAATKRAAIERYGARVIDCEPTMAARNTGMANVLAETGAAAVHPFDDARVIAGQGTATLELLEQTKGALDIVMAPVSGGGLLSGTAIAAHGRDARMQVWGAEPASASDAQASLAQGRRITEWPIDTICDGLRATLGELPFAILSKHTAGIVTATEDQIIAAMRLMFERLKIVVEPSAAVVLAAILSNPAPFAGRRIGVIVSGGNLDLDRLPWQ